MRVFWLVLLFFFCFTGLHFMQIQCGDEARLIDGVLCISSAVMQECFAVSRATLGNWAKHGCPKSKSGWWPLVGVIKWRGMSGQSLSSELSDTERKIKADADWKEQQAAAIAKKNAISDEEYIPAAEIISTLSEHSAVMKRSMQGLSRKIAAEVSPFVDPIVARKIESQLAELVDEALTIMSVGNVYVPPRRRAIKG